MIILNEREYAETCLRDGAVGDSIFQTLGILSKYYYSIGYRQKKITSSLLQFLENNYFHYRENENYWIDCVRKIASQAGKHPLYEFDGVWITQKELDTIENIDSKLLRRIAFTYLCLAKFNILKNPKSNGWVNLSDKDVFKLAHINCTIEDRDIKIGTLYDYGYLYISKKIESSGVQVLFIDADGEGVLHVSDFRELGYEYLLYCGENYIRCAECGILTKGNKRGTKRYCSKCVGYSPQDGKKIVCVDCGTEFLTNSMNNRACRCDDCYKEYRKNKKLETQRMRRESSVKSDQF